MSVKERIPSGAGYSLTCLMKVFYLSVYRCSFHCNAGCLGKAKLEVTWDFKEHSL